ncbi:hypothetical protein D3C84_923590 [compost metagenome]
MFIYPPIAGLQPGLGSVHVLARQPGIKERNKALVDLRRQKAEPFLQPIPFQRAIGWSQPHFGLLVSQILHDRRAFPKPGSICQFKDRHIAERIYIVIVDVTVHRVLPVIHLEQRDIKTKFIDHDMRGKGAAARDVVKLHERSPNRSGTSLPSRK